MIPLALSLLLLPVFAPNPRETCTNTDSLTVRNGHTLAYHPGVNAVLLFGGADERRVLADLWAWDGTRWRCLAGGGPPPRTFPALAYDPVGERLIVFGGNRVLFGTDRDTATFLDDMWAWDGHAWQRLEGAMPTARAEAGIAYDSDRRRVVLFGGYRTEQGQRIRLGDTWEWDGRRWELKSEEGPAPRNGTALAYDARRKRVVLFGGNGPSGETWEWDGGSWQRIETAQTEGRFNSALAYDEERKTILRFGGWNGQERVGDTWRYDGAQWTHLAAEGPAPRNHTSMSYDGKRGVLVLFGGHDGEQVFGDTWEWDGSRWSNKATHPPRRRIDNGH